jgi:hypothetical protein
MVRLFAGALHMKEPPKARIAFRVGVVGHRPDRLPDDEEGLARIRARIAEVLEATHAAVDRFAASPRASLYDSGGPTLTANSPLAEGSDRIFAEEALRLGWKLTCIMPFASGEFEQDFAGPDSFEARSVERFRGILETAEERGVLTRFEINGRRDRANEAYEAAGRVVLNQSDLLVVVWDGGAAAGVGGTVDTLREAIAFNVPTLWVDSRAPFGWKLMRDAEDLECLGDTVPRPPPPESLEDQAHLARAIDLVVRTELDTPEMGDGSEGAAATAAHLLEYQDETRPRFNLAIIWKLFRDFMDRGVIHTPRIRVADFVSQIRANWPVAGEPGTTEDYPGAYWINARLRNHYAWSDKLADIFADKHRSAFVTSSLLAATAVFLAVVPFAGRFGSRASIITGIVEAIILLATIALPMVARRRRWHQKWLEYRVLAELVREMQILVPLGGARPLPRTPAHLSSYGDPALSWMNWQARAIAREIGLPNAKVDHHYIVAMEKTLLDFLGTVTPESGQIGFHHMNCERMERIHSRLHRMSLILFTVSLAAVAFNWLVRFLWPDLVERVSDWMVLFSAFLPAMGAALASINNNGEFARLQRRARAMAESLSDVRHRIVNLAAEQEAPALARLTELAAEIASMMVEETTEWRIVVLEVPHSAG